MTDDPSPIAPPAEGAENGTISWASDELPAAEPDAETLTSASDAGDAPAAERQRGGRTWQWVVAAVIGAVVGALVAGGVFLVADDDAPSAVQAAPDAVVSRPSRVIEDDGGVAAIIAKVEPAVVAITTGSGPTAGGGAGTGFVITPDGYIVTNNHVVEGETRITVAFTNGDEKAARLVGREAGSDLAVLKVDGSNLPVATLGSSDDVQVGDEVVAIGNALALDGGLSVTRGIISGLHRTVATDAGARLFGMLQTDAAINPGNSGGPLVNANGEVIGINTAIANPEASNNIGFAIPLANARPIIDDLRLGRAAAFLGVAAQNVTPAIARQQSLGVTSGALVTQVTPGSAADDAGVRVGDVIVAIGGERVSEASDVQSLVRRHRPGDTVDVVVNRGGAERTLTATLEERPDA